MNSINFTFSKATRASSHLEKSSDSSILGNHSNVTRSYLLCLTILVWLERELTRSKVRKSSHWSLTEDLVILFKAVEVGREFCGRFGLFGVGMEVDEEVNKSEVVDAGDWDIRSTEGSIWLKQTHTFCNASA
eukprot:TRINITY_DN6227_c0_g1_i4.p1 TRINITY_DN6227_c0_g1~~TRINITY_DN6227_c0_g1_i4.p1  ORF type:complete len:132 (-),score=9.21 TRINITY_DN6227_c0_g1_i4:81-476(-)